MIRAARGVGSAVMVALLAVAASCATTERPRTPAEQAASAAAVERVRAWLADQLGCAPSELQLQHESWEQGEYTFERAGARYDCADDLPAPSCAGLADEPAGGADAGRDAGTADTGGPPALEALGASDVMHGILAQTPALKECAAVSRRAQPALSGKIVVRFTIEPSGVVSRARPLPRSLSESVFARCVVDVLLGTKFPRHRVKGEQVTFPFKF